jgi:hypothetical protein
MSVSTKTTTLRQRLDEVFSHLLIDDEEALEVLQHLLPSKQVHNSKRTTSTRTTLKKSALLLEDPKHDVRPPAASAAHMEHSSTSTTSCSPVEEQANDGVSHSPTITPFFAGPHDVSRRNHNEDTDVRCSTPSGDDDWEDQYDDEDNANDEDNEEIPWDTEEVTVAKPGASFVRGQSIHGLLSAADADSIRRETRFSNGDTIDLEHYLHSLVESPMDKKLSQKIFSSTGYSPSDALIVASVNCFSRKKKRHFFRDGLYLCSIFAHEMSMSLSHFLRVRGWLVTNRKGVLHISYRRIGDCLRLLGGDGAAKYMRLSAMFDRLYRLLKSSDVWPEMPYEDSTHTNHHPKEAVIGNSPHCFFVFSIINPLLGPLTTSFLSFISGRFEYY